LGPNVEFRDVEWSHEKMKGNEETKKHIWVPSNFLIR